MRYNEYLPGDDLPEMAGDNRFVGVNMRLDPAQLPPGYVSEAINMRFRSGVAETRKGLTRLGWMQRTAIVSPADPIGSELDIWLEGAPVVAVGTDNGELDIWLEGAPVIDQRS